MTTKFDALPELKYEPKCRVCQLANEHPGIVQLVHKYKVKDKYGASPIAARIRDVVVAQGIRPISSRSINRHFEGHVDFDQLYIKAPAENVFKVDGTNLDAAETEMINHNLRDLALGKNDSDYHNMVELFRRLMRRIIALDADPMAFLSEDGKNHSTNRLNTWKSMIDSAARIVSDLNRMRNQDKMTVSILENHTKKFATAVAGPIGAEIREVRDQLIDIQDPKAQQLALRLDALLTVGVTDIFSKAATSSLRQSKEQYKLPN